MTKKILVISLIILIVILLAGFTIVKLFAKPENKVENLLEGVKIETQEPTSENVKDNNQPQINIEGVKVDSEKDNGGLSICVVKCGDGICQQTDPECGKPGNNNLNCICLETPLECPEDCK